ncbi:ABC transporter ATP-binding protein [Tianweitania sp. BSSL-BM11]|uniref:ABC transporter ATP-binding protein n=1 Tax=Tianweitania aestuarii TaxID=2814886 RepID=A0ABS5RVG9_9HYPH|nr:ABC transporter ATP-binding protein [Tianweitania aestuarii]MBS9719697.1 ABC transporter ATP-binding protein [Tianweitania aestuarii]
MSAPLLAIRDLTVSFATRRGGHAFQAVSGVDLTVQSGEVHGVVGESGSGKSVTMLAVMQLLSQSATIAGSIMLDGQELTALSDRQMRKIRGARIGYIFQDPMTALNPLLTVGEQIAEAVRIHRGDVGHKHAVARAIDLLRLVAIPNPEKRANQYPHEFSGGMRQRAVIAMAMANEPDLLIADEPTTALDVTIQAQIMELLDQLRREKNIGIVLVTHDLGVVAGVAKSLSIMYAGRVVERGLVDDVFAAPHHPYTKGLLESLPQMDERVERLSAIAGAPPPISARPSGCPFHPRCPYVIERCRSERPVLRPVGPIDVACHRAEIVAADKGTLQDA